MTALKKYIYKINTFLKRDAQAEITGVLNMICPETDTVVQVKKQKQTNFGIKSDMNKTTRKKKNRWRPRSI